MEGYGDCINESPASACLENEFCVGTGNGTEAVCAHQCNEVSDCPDVPSGGNPTVMCVDFTANGLPECRLDCSGGETCPTGMFCLQQQSVSLAGLIPVMGRLRGRG